MSDLSTKIIISLGGILVIAALVLTAVVVILFFNVSKMLKAVMECVLEANSANTKDKVILAETAAADSCPKFQFCDECKMYADYDPLPPCFCDINEGL